MKPLLISLLLIVASCPLFGQNSTASTNTLLGFSVQSSPSILDRLDAYELTTEREKSLYARYQDTLNARLVRFALKPFYAELANAEATLEPTDALAEYLTYGKDGLPSILFPKQAIKRVTKKGYTTDYYYTTQISIQANGIMNGISNRVKPKVSCQIKVFNAEGGEVSKVKAEVLASNFIKSTEFPRLSFDKIGLDHIEILQSRLEPLVQQAVQEAVSKL